MSILSHRACHWVSAGCVAVLAFAALVARAQQRPTLEPKNWTAAEDHRQMMEQLGITALRPGPSGNEQDPNHANYDEAKANPFPKLPDVLTLKNGTQGRRRAQQWTRRRAEIVEDFEREVFGRVPKNVPKVDVEGHRDGHRHDRRTARRRAAAHRPRRQLVRIPRSPSTSR